MAFDFIPQNNTSCTDENFETLLNCWLENIGCYACDGSNPHTRRHAVARERATGRLKFVDPELAGIFRCDIVMTPSTDDHRRALAIFKEKGYFPYYDSECGYYGLVRDKADVKGAYAIRCARWL